MSVPDIDKLYDEQIRSLPRAAQLTLLARIATDLAATAEVSAAGHSIMELRGLGAELWRAIDVARYVDQLRNDWDAPPR